jgi:hypothetical protein
MGPTRRGASGSSPARSRRPLRPCGAPGDPPGAFAGIAPPPARAPGRKPWASSPPQHTRMAVTRDPARLLDDIAGRVRRDSRATAPGTRRARAGRGRPRRPSPAGLRARLAGAATSARHPSGRFRPHVPRRRSPRTPEPLHHRGGAGESAQETDQRDESRPRRRLASGSGSRPPRAPKAGRSSPIRSRSPGPAPVAPDAVARSPPVPGPTRVVARAPRTRPRQPSPGSCTIHAAPCRPRDRGRSHQASARMVKRPALPRGRTASGPVARRPSPPGLRRRVRIRGRALERPRVGDPKRLGVPRSTETWCAPRRSSHLGGFQVC